MEVAVYSTVFLDIVFMILACYKNEKINFSQTWRLIPISNKKFFLANLLSTFYNCILIFIPQVIVVSIFWSLSSPNNFTELFGEVLITPLYDNKIFFILVTLIAIVLVIQTFISLVNFMSNIIAEFVSIKNSRVIRWFLMVTFVIVGAYLAIKITDSMALYLDKVINNSVASNLVGKKNYLEDYTISMLSTYLLPLEMLIGSIIFGGMDLWLIDKFVEAKQNN
ncbi:hypothetical protein [Lactobacillus hamsteri]|nr:hypothetical protein [Lactobacillus hamsteri]